MRSTPIPKTKLRPPTLFQPVIRRPRLREAFYDRRPLTVISAPAGSGKTTLALDWCASLETNLAWLSLDQDDNDPLRFIHALGAALRMAGAPWRIPAGQRDLKAIMAALINQLGETEPIALVLDDYHLITEEKVHLALAYFLELVPASMQVVIITREEPPLPLARWRARGQLREINFQDLRFTAEEARMFLKQGMGLDLSTEQIHALEGQMQGWVAGLQMAGLSLKANKEPAISSSHERKFITEYLLTEVFNRQSGEIQDFLLNTSILETFSVPLCKALVSGNAGNILVRVGKANLFVTTVGGWHQYHPIFREFLQAQLQDKFPERLVSLHREALAWMEKNGLLAEGIQHALAIPDHAAAARLMAALAPDYLKRGELVTLRRWLGRLPEPVLWAHPRLCLTQIWLLLDANLQVDAQSYFDRLGNFLEQNLQGEFLAVQSLHAAMNHQPALALEFAKRAQRSPEAKDPFIQTYVSFGMGAAQKMGLNFFHAEQSFRESLTLADADGNSYIAIASLVNLADVLYLQARLFDAETTCKQALKRFGDYTPDARDWYWTLARIAYQRNELDDSLAWINRTIDLCLLAEEKTIHSRALLQRALVYSALDRKKLAQADLEAADLLARGLQDQVIVRSVIRQRVLFAVDEGDRSCAQQWLQVLGEYGEQPFPFFQAYARGRVFLAQEDFEAAKREFDFALQSLEAADFALVRIEVMVWQAVCLGLLDEVREGGKRLQNAIRASQTEKVVRPFIEARTGLLRLVEKTGQGGFEWALKFLNENGQQAGGPPLTRREREVWQLLTLGLSNREIAERLVVTEGTLKRHVANLYRKIGAHNRAQAIKFFHQQ